MSARFPKLAPDCGVCPIRHRAVCGLADPDELKRLSEIKYYRSYEAGQAIVWSGDRMDFVGSVVSGTATLTSMLMNGRTQMVGLLLPSDFVGRPGRDFAAYTVIAVTDVVMCCFRKRAFEAVLDSSRPVSRRLLELTLDELDAAREWMLVLGRKSARERIASLLQNIARRGLLPGPGKRGNSASFDLPLMREEMADYLGLTTETVSRQLSALRRDSVIELKGRRRVHVPNLNRLAEEAGDDSGICDRA